MDKARAFLVRDLLLNTSYRLSFLLSIAGTFASVAIFFYVSELFGDAVSPHLAEYDGDYFGFVLIGVAFSGLVSTSLTTFSTSISSAQAEGTLEAVLVTPTSITTIVILSSLWSFLFNSMNVFAYLAFGKLAFGFSLSRANFPAALLVLLLATVIFSGLGIISAAFIMLFKRGNPIESFYALGSTFLGGMYFPTTVLPSWLQPFSYLLPIFYALRAMRLAVLKGHTVVQIQQELLALSVFAAVIVPASVWAFKQAIRVAKRDGSLVTY